MIIKIFHQIFSLNSYSWRVYVIIIFSKCFNIFNYFWIFLFFFLNFLFVFKDDSVSIFLIIF